ncbi:hypothetical protein COW36_11705 [bacterium (Candidatus Blackallbacteria) CG17_big_fil_post_rev_8_21_14_2_50_48_46]|uniref:HEAT repeat domain-containing protein n=1 Tax=bacterium (Candidatus Blackallbacteria) CG17_big_fil_post_rev_8_21_14_2_50_48_46 TaxID=2014261 RepID=A0A2M7G3H6_9BACT|nr:MAG: hypothetical protein COW64_03560 [bacterium (Candidatus Blackallbacteria) CG18_big_fil_WC_8_21_14_2_50_49_26]PIW16429.1 MAG: hypothetical protein COW36_11705 [bacterium (Candidatus Blackallbacteria) CG17_big_fil_post_rev_8_21_14_2_50_48_46]PIW45937.1 MAG: hypothetical protein COW20_16970 [bacterium (Candidatus Blackallbacteria) CG13_big_fil_rev_8_21_14_2_50_49_14]
MKKPQPDFQALWQNLRRACAFEQMPLQSAQELGQICGPKEIEFLIQALLQLVDADLEDDPGDLSDEYWRLRRTLTEALVAAGSQVIQPLLCNLNSPNLSAVGYFAEALGRLQAPEALEPLLALYQRHADQGLRWSVITALGDLNDSRALPLLKQTLLAPPELNRGWWIRLTAQALGKLQAPEVLPIFEHILTQDADWFARLGIVEGLLSFHPTPEIRRLLERGKRDSDSRVAELARRSI